MQYSSNSSSSSRHLLFDRRRKPRRYRRDSHHPPPTHLRRYAAGRCRLAHTPLAPDENPLQALLVHEVLEGRVQLTEVCHLGLEVPRRVYCSML